jgi:hypothetical protein
MESTQQVIEIRSKDPKMMRDVRYDTITNMMCGIVMMVNLDIDILNVHSMFAKEARKRIAEEKVKLAFILKEMNKK